MNCYWDYRKMREIKNLAEEHVNVKSHGRSERHIIVRDEELRFLEGSQASLARPSDS
jgi:hypothetical protein